MFTTQRVRLGNVIGCNYLSSLLLLLTYASNFSYLGEVGNIILGKCKLSRPRSTAKTFSVFFRNNLTYFSVQTEARHQNLKSSKFGTIFIKLARKTMSITILKIHCVFIQTDAAIVTTYLLVCIH